jgi:hypothetical protein
MMLAPAIAMRWFIGGAIGAAAVTGALSLALYFQSARLERCEQRYRNFVAEQKRLGEEARREAQRREDAAKKAKEKTDAEIRALRARADDLARRLRDERARAGYVPPAPAGTGDPGLACFDRAELERAIARLDAGVSELAREGDEAAVALESLRAWARELRER